MNDLHTVTTPEAAQLLTSEPGRKLIRPFMARECTLSEVASELELNLSTLSYRVKQFLEAGLIRIVREEKRQGRAMKVYRASARRYYIPFFLTPAESLESMLAEMVTSTHQLFNKNLVQLMQRERHDWELFLSFDTKDEGLSYGFKPPGVDEQEFGKFLLEPTAPAVFMSSGLVELSFEEAKAVQHALAELSEKTCHKRGGQRYLFYYGLTPVELEE